MDNRLLCFAYFCLLGIATVNNTLPLMAAPYIVGELGGGREIAFYTITFYSIGYALGVPLGVRSVGRIQPRSFFFVILFGLALCSLFLICSTTYPLFLLFRFFQGFFAGPLFPMVSILLLPLFPEEKRDQCTKAILTLFTVVPAFGAAVGGWVAYDYHWQWIFFANLLFSALLLPYLWVKLKEVGPVGKRVPFDRVGYLFYTLALLPLSFALTMGQELDWFRSQLITALFALGGLALLFFLLWENRQLYPILNLRLLKNAAFAFAMLALALLFSSYFGMVILLGYWLNFWVNYTPIWIGLILVTMVVAGFFPLLLFRRGYENVDSRIPLAFGILLLGCSALHTIYFNQEVNFERIALSRAIAGFGLGFFLPPIFRLAFHTFSPHLALAVTPYFQLVRVLASGLGAACYLTLWQRREAFYHERLGGQLTLFSPETTAYYERAQRAGLQGREATEVLGDLLNRQAAALALEDCFYLMSWLLAGLFLLLLLTRLFKQPGFKPEKNPLHQHRDV